MAHVPVHKKYQNLDKISKKIRYLDISGKGEIGLGNDNFSKSSINTTRDVMASQGMVVAFGEGFGDSDIIDTAHNYILNEEIDFIPGVAESARTSGAQLRIFSPLATSKFKFLRGKGYEFDSAESILSPEMRRRVSEMDLSPEEQQQGIGRL